jgi:nucleotide-binding universal stress UspA family protein
MSVPALEVSQMSRPIVVAVDGSEESMRAAGWAAREAVRQAAPLRIVSAPGPLPRMRTYQAPAATVANALRGIASRALADAVDRVGEVAPGLPVETGLLDGPPAVAVADSGGGARLLVVGARGGGGFAALALGSVSRYIASHAPCPVVVVREETWAVHREIVVGVRDPDEADVTLEFAFAEAARRGAALTAVHALSWCPLGGTPSAATGKPATREPATAAEAAKLHLNSVLDQWRRKYPDVTAAAEVVHGHPAHLLARLSASADLLVIGRHDIAGGADVSSMQHGVLGHAHGPVAIVPSGPFAAVSLR